MEGKPSYSGRRRSLENLSILGDAFDRVWPVDARPFFDGLVQALDQADREMGRRRKRQDERTSGSINTKEKGR